ncbi:hypothetical protein [Nonomuraea phyllanthi]|nr:hypothetical protein [Nonomuraea phyllanthi]
MTGKPARCADGAASWAAGAGTGAGEQAAKARAATRTSTPDRRFMPRRVR